MNLNLSQLVNAYNRLDRPYYPRWVLLYTDERDIHYPKERLVNGHVRASLLLGQLRVQIGEVLAGHREYDPMLNGGNKVISMEAPLLEQVVNEVTGSHPR